MWSADFHMPCQSIQPPKTVITMAATIFTDNYRIALLLDGFGNGHLQIIEHRLVFVDTTV